ncbi:MAG: hypothetical protein H6839_03575 [Planctomycetes bacterium]|nr:hypothetical protein [Planctomycetota bacterium]
MDSVEKLILRTGPTLSSEPVKLLVAQGLTPAAARQRVSRARGSVKRLAGLRLPNREAFLFLDGQYGKDSWKESLSTALIQSRSAYGRALQGLIARGGSVPANQFTVASGLAIKPAKGQIPHTVVSDKLRDLGLIEQIDPGDGPMVALWDADAYSHRARAVRIAEGILLSAMRSWLIKLGWSSTGTLAVRNQGSPPNFGQFAWDIVGPSYLSGLVNYVKGQQKVGFIVGDVVLDRAITLNDLSPFLSKWDSLAAQDRSTRFQPMFVAEFLEGDALMLLRKKGALVCIPNVLFGEEVARDLKQLVASIENAAAAVVNDPASLFSLIERMAKIEGAVLNLRGVVLELIVGHLYKSRGYTIDIRFPIRQHGQVLAEVDVKAKDRRELVCVECKGNAAGNLVDAPEIELWERSKLPEIKKWIGRSDELPPVRRFEFISSTDYTPDARSLIAKLEEKHRKQPVRFLAGDDVLERLNFHRERSLINVFREHFKP